MKRAILSIIAVSASLMVATNAAALGFGGDTTEQNQGQAQGQLQGQAQGQLQGQAQGQGQFSVNKNGNKNYNGNANFNGNSNANKNYNSSKATGIGVGISGSNNEGNNTTSQNSVTINEAEYLKKSRVDIRNNPDINAPGLVANGDCMGSTSTGVSGGLVGATFGTTWTDDGCDTRYLAGYAKEMGGKDAGTRVLCLEEKMQRANPSLCNRVYDAAQFTTTAGTKIDMSYRPGKDVVSNEKFDNGFWQ